MKNTCLCFFPAGIKSLVLETQHLRVFFEVLDPYLGCLALEAQNLRIHFEVLDPDLGCLVLETQICDLVSERDPLKNISGPLLFVTWLFPKQRLR